MIGDLRFTNKKKTIISLSLTLLVIGGLLAIATFYDLQISKILTKGSLKIGDYISSSGFALFFEAVGASALYIMLSIAGVIAFWYGARYSKNNVVKYIYAFVGAVMVIVGFFMTFKDIFSYVGEYIGANLTAVDVNNVLIDDARDLAGSLYIELICVLMAVISAIALIKAWKKVKKEDNDRYIWWAYAIVCTVVFYLIVHFVKSPAGRARYRTMNYLNDFDYYTPWYVMNGKRSMVDLVQKVLSHPLTESEQARYNFVSDACKSFPSGHTFSAGMVYTLLALPYLNEKFAKKNVRFALWASCIAYTGIVAISRIVAGAHFMSDVLVGGSIAFGGAMISREIFVCRGLHFKQLFAKPVQETVLEEVAISENIETTPETETVETVETDSVTVETDSETVETIETVDTVETVETEQTTVDTDGTNE